MRRLVSRRKNNNKYRSFFRYSPEYGIVLIIENVTLQGKNVFFSVRLYIYIAVMWQEVFTTVVIERS